MIRRLGPAQWLWVCDVEVLWGHCRRKPGEASQQGGFPSGPEQPSLCLFGRSGFLYLPLNRLLARWGVHGRFENHWLKGPRRLPRLSPLSVSLINLQVGGSIGSDPKMCPLCPAQCFKVPTFKIWEISHLKIEVLFFVYVELMCLIILCSHLQGKVCWI